MDLDQHEGNWWQNFHLWKNYTFKIIFFKRFLLFTAKFLVSFQLQLPVVQSKSSSLCLSSRLRCWSVIQRVIQSASQPPAWVQPGFQCPAQSWCVLQHSRASAMGPWPWAQRKRTSCSLSSITSCPSGYLLSGHTVIRWVPFLSFFLAFFLSFLLSFLLSCFLSFFLSCFLAFFLSCFLSLSCL